MTQNTDDTQMNPWYWLGFRAYGTDHSMGATIIQAISPEHAIQKAKLLWLHPTALVDVRDITKSIDKVSPQYRKKLLSYYEAKNLEKQL